MKELLTAIRERAKKLAPKVGYPIFYLVCFVVFASWTFPYDRLKERIVVSFNAGQRAAGSQQELSIDDLTSSWITGVKAKGVRLSTPASEPGKPPTDTTIDSAVIRMSLLGLLVGNKDISFKVSAFGGAIRGDYDDHGKSRAMDVTLDGVDVGQITPVRDAIGLPMEGSISGTLKLDMPDGQANKANGSMTFDIADLAVGDGKAKLKGALALPRMNVGTLSIAGEAKDGVLAIKKMGASGKDLELVGDGRVQLRETFGESVVDMNVRFKINDAYRTKNDITKSLFGAPNSTAPALFDLADPKVKQSKRPDGFYAWHARGPFAHPDFQPAGTAAAGPAFGGPAFGGGALPFAAPSTLGGLKP